MAAIVRVKRRRQDDPADSLLLSSKRLKSNNEQTEERVADVDAVQSVFRFAGTMTETDATKISIHIREAIRKEKLQREYKRHQGEVDFTNRARQEHKAAADESRYRIIAQKRALELEGLDIPQDKTVYAQGEVRQSVDKQNKKGKQESSGQKRKEEDREDGAGANSKDNSDPGGGAAADRMYLLYDVEAQTFNQSNNQIPDSKMKKQKKDGRSDITCNGVVMQREAVVNGASGGSTVAAAQPGPSQQAASSTDADFVYDLYYMNRGDFDFRSLENVLAISAFQEDLQFEDYRDADEMEAYDDDDDSNEEDNWRNDYPDEDPNFFENEDGHFGFADAHERAMTAAFGGEEEWGISDQLRQALLFDENGYVERDTDSEEEYAEQAEEAAAAAADEIYPGDDPASVLMPMRNYDTYRQAMMKELGEDESR